MIKFCPYCGSKCVYPYDTGYNSESYTCNKCNKRFKVEEV